MDEKWVTVAQIAKQLQVNEETVRRWLRARQLGRKELWREEWVSRARARPSGVSRSGAKPKNRRLEQA